MIIVVVAALLFANMEQNRDLPTSLILWGDLHSWKFYTIFCCRVEDHAFVALKLGAKDPLLDLVVFFEQYICTCSVWSAKKHVCLKNTDCKQKKCTEKQRLKIHCVLPKLTPLAVCWPICDHREQHFWHGMVFLWSLSCRLYGVFVSMGSCLCYGFFFFLFRFSNGALAAEEMLHLAVFHALDWHMLLSLCTRPKRSNTQLSASGREAKSMCTVCQRTLALWWPTCSHGQLFVVQSGLHIQVFVMCVDSIESCWGWFLFCSFMFSNRKLKVPCQLQKILISLVAFFKE